MIVDVHSLRNEAASTANPLAGNLTVTRHSVKRIFRVLCPTGLLGAPHL